MKRNFIATVGVKIQARQSHHPLQLSFLKQLMERNFIAKESLPVTPPT